MTGETKFVTVATVGSIPDGGSRAIAVGQTIVALFRQGDQYYAINDVCPHMGASLAEGYVEDGIVTCPWHAWRFCVRDGTWCDNPSIKTDSYPVRIVGDQIQVQLGKEEG